MPLVIFDHMLTSVQYFNHFMVVVIFVVVVDVIVVVVVIAVAVAIIVVAGDCFL